MKTSTLKKIENAGWALQAIGAMMIATSLLDMRRAKKEKKEREEQYIKETNELLKNL